mmetsp:Transcript_18976/g.22808  ORF Transcript_18976/g.22808 Transcript_18976/m.22808 type:complete len:230 (+) Transcript_18976:221-910(+)|eukprot:CAMPEP_0195282418 /NCGR_PEP_ID=MMETSP0707-20130614/1296_1 /TAXON_ID=33640 /ORGANISM="Asterionellopsis glacialis, Strain CCMP134" /LENGTH=229 /DNA_ID=CAMNT_0040341385 /DNA_START=180 /DNA_END=869 /DNA_ORIENTATION=-
MENDDETQASMIRLSDFPDAYKSSVRNLVGQFDVNGDGCIDAEELSLAVEALKNSRQKNNHLTKIVVGLTIASFLLIGSIFGVSVAAARLAKDTKIDDDSGFLFTKDKHSVVKTGEAVTWSTPVNLVDMDNEDLVRIKYLSWKSANAVHFHVKGYARSSSGEKVIFLVEGGTLTFQDTLGLSNATGDARVLLETAGADFEKDVLENEGTRGLHACLVPNSPLCLHVGQY